MGITITELVDSCTELVSFPDVAIRVNRMVNDPNVTATEIGEVISQDPALTTAILKVANSPLFGLSKKIDTVSRAVTLLGSKQVRDLALAGSATKAFNAIPNDLLSMDDFWYHSLSCALAAQELADMAKLRKLESVFISGLLHDIGQLLLFYKAPDVAVKNLMLSLDGDHELYQAEQDVMGFDHAQLGAALAKAWDLPESLQTCIMYHHEPSKAETYKVETAITHIANSLACLVEIDSNQLNDAPPICPAAWQLLGLTEDVAPAIITSVKEKADEMQAALT